MSPRITRLKACAAVQPEPVGEGPSSSSGSGGSGSVESGPEERLLAGEALPLYAHGGGRELSTKRWDHYKDPVAYVQVAGSEPMVSLSVAVELVEALRKAVAEFAIDHDGTVEGCELCEVVASDALRRFDALHKGEQ